MERMYSVANGFDLIGADKEVRQYFLCVKNVKNCSAAALRCKRQDQVSAPPRRPLRLCGEASFRDLRNGIYGAHSSNSVQADTHTPRLSFCFPSFHSRGPVIDEL